MWECKHCKRIVQDSFKKAFFQSFNVIASTGTKLTPYDIVDLISICLSSSDFIYNERHHTTKDSGPIGLSLMVTVSQLWMTNTMEKGLKIARDRGCVVPRHVSIYMDDVWATVSDPPRRPGLRSTDNNSDPIRDPAAEFKDCLNSVHERVQFTLEKEEEMLIAFLQGDRAQLTKSKN